MNKYGLTLGKGWFDDPLAAGEGFSGGSKYADLGIYYKEENILPLCLDHYDVMLDKRLDVQMRVKLESAITEINEKNKYSKR